MLIVGCANALVKLKVHLSTVIAGYKLTLKESCKSIMKQFSTWVDIIGKEAIVTYAILDY